MNSKNLQVLLLLILKHDFLIIGVYFFRVNLVSVAFCGAFSHLLQCSPQLGLSCGRQVSLEGRTFPCECKKRGGKPQLHFVLASSLPLSLPPPFTNPLTPDSENRWRGKWGFGAEEFTVSRETFTSIWVAHSTFWNPIVTFHSGGQQEFRCSGTELMLSARGKHWGSK